MGLGFFVLFILLVDYIFVGDFEFLLLVGGICWIGIGHLRHVEDLEHGVEVEVIHVQTLQDYLGDDEVDVVLLQLDLLEEVEEEFFRDSALSVTLGSQSSHDLLVVCGN